MSAVDLLNAALAGRYRIERELGAGGMATVFLAEDLKHKRHVAVKVLKPELAAVLGAERFVQEITTTASLQHPHILALFDSGTADGFLFYVMPWIDGETLREKLTRETQLSVDQAVRIAREVLDALEYAHQRGIVHRDVKPENILLHGGHAMVADFGIALAVSAAAGGRMTETGLSVGTPHYMSPEQATAEKDITPRSDVYSLGSVLYEMLTGQPPHHGGSAQQIIMKIIAEPVPAVTSLRKSVPPNVAAAVARALEKLPADRFESARAFTEALGNPSYTNAAPGDTAAGSAIGARLLTRPLIATSVLAVAATAVALWGWWGRTAGEAPLPLVRFYVTGDSTRSIGEAVAISPDGRTIVFLGRTRDGRSLFVQQLDAPDARPIPGTSDVTPDALFFSPDGAAVAFSAGARLKRVRLDGSDLAVIAPIGFGSSGAWGPDGTIVFSTYGSPLKRVNASGGAVTDVPAHQGDEQHLLLYSPRFLPGGRSILCVESAPSDSFGVLDLSSGEFRAIGRGYSPSYSRGYLLYLTATGSLMAQRFDPARGNTRSASERVLDGIDMLWTLLGRYDVSNSGAVVYRPRGSGDVNLTLFQADGTKRILMRGGRFWVPRISPNGRTIVFGAYENAANLNAEIWTYDLTTGTDQRLTTGGWSGRDFNDPTWSRNGRRIAFDGLDNAAGDQSKVLYVVPANGTGRPQLVPTPHGRNFPSDWTPDDQYIVFDHNVASRPTSIWMVASDGKGEARPIVEATFDAYGGRVSPDGRWLAYQSNETGQDEVYVQPFPAPGPRVRISTAGGGAPSWTRNGRELVYRVFGQTEQLVGVELTLGAAVGIGARRVLLRDANIPVRIADYDVTSDGRRVVVVIAPPSPNRFAVVLDLLTDRKR
jgi:serine/threonine-protein kinase